jgi:DNA transposition AAA+ family ATPase
LETLCHKGFRANGPFWTESLPSPSHRYDRLSSSQLVETSAIWEMHVLKLPQPSHLSSAKMQKVLGPASGGYIGLLDRIVREAAVRSLEQGFERIELSILKAVATECR